MPKYKVVIEERGGGGENQELDIEATSEGDARTQATGQVRGVIKSVTLADEAQASSDADADADATDDVRSGPTPDQLEDDPNTTIQDEGTGPFASREPGDGRS